MGRRVKTDKLFIRLLACVIAGFLTVGCINVKAEDSTGNYVYEYYYDFDNMAYEGLVDFINSQTQYDNGYSITSSQNQSIAEVSTLAQLRKAIKNPDIKEIYFNAPDTKKITIQKCKGSGSKKLTINAGKAKITNKARFSNVVINDCTAYIEKASGNTITVDDNESTISVEASVKNVSIIINAAKTKVNVKKKASAEIISQWKDGGFIDKAAISLNVSEKADVSLSLKTGGKVTLKGTNSKKTKIENCFYGNEITSYVPVEVYALSYTTVTLKKGSEKSVLKSDEDFTYSFRLNNSSSMTPSIYQGKKLLVKAETKASFNDEAKVYKKLMAMKTDYPQGLKWTNEDNSYLWKGSSNFIGFGCAAFAFLMSDAAFGYAPARMHTDFSKIKVGDILRVDNDSHSVIVLKIEGDEVTIAEGNYNRSVNWGRKLSKKRLINGQGNYVWTRYLD